MALIYELEHNNEFLFPEEYILFQHGKYIR